MPPFRLQRRRSKSPDKSQRSRDSFDELFSAPSSTAGLRRTESNVGRTSHVSRSSSERVALPEVREMIDHVDRRTRVTGNAFSGLRHVQSKALLGGEEKQQQKASS
jgi:hypothetical protein